MSPKARPRSEPPRRPDEKHLSDVSFLRSELKRLQVHGFGTGLRDIVWSRSGASGKEAEVVGDTILIYTRDRESARQALMHEVLHAELVALQAPFVDLLNRILEGVNEEAHRRVELLTENLREYMEFLGP